ncbi:MAG: FAD binding domain-containing protein [Myxococcota bacterium]
MNYQCPSTLKQCLDSLSRDNFILIAGGTDLFIKLEDLDSSKNRFMDLSNLPLNEIKINEASPPRLIIGSTANMGQIASNPLVQKHAPVLARACSETGGPQVRNRATLGGNIANASPAADSVCALTALEATVKVQSSSASREIPLGDFFTGPGRTVLQPGELITWINIPIPQENPEVKTIHSWYKMGNRKAAIISLAAFAARLSLDQNNRILSSSTALASVGPTCVKALKTDAFLKGKELNNQTIQQAREILKQEISPISDFRGSADYRKHICSSFLKKHLHQTSFGGEHLLAKLNPIPILKTKLVPQAQISDQPQTIRLLINGEKHKYTGEPGQRLLDYLRDELHLTGTKNGCKEGECGACTVLLDGIPVNSCLVPMGSLNNREVITIEGITNPDGSMGKVQEAYVEAGAVQCGFCTPGFEIVTEFLRKNQLQLSPEEIKRELSGNLCRCTGYKHIIDAVEKVLSTTNNSAREKNNE